VAGNLVRRDCLPFLKWPGGKRWLTPHIYPLIRDSRFRRYFEPFLGGGAIYFGFQPHVALLSDINQELVNTYVQVRKHSSRLISALKAMPVDRSTYEQVRAYKPVVPFDRAVRFLYLNRTGFAGMYRVNRQGEFNVPFGGDNRTPEALWERCLLEKAARALRATTIVTLDFEDAIDMAGESDLVYCDPTYTVNHNDNGFRRYNESVFSWTDQRRLAAAARRARGRGATVLISNANHDEVIDLYPESTCFIFARHTLLSSTPTGRRLTSESLFLLRPVDISPYSNRDEVGQRRSECRPRESLHPTRLRSMRHPRLGN
jgi:DNA adenine methylase